MCACSAAAAAAKSLQSCPTLCDPIDHTSLPHLRDSPQARALEWGAIAFSGVHAQSCPDLCDPVYCNLPGSTVHGIVHQEYWSRLLFPPPGDLSNPDVKPASPALAAGCFTTASPGKPLGVFNFHIFIFVSIFVKLYSYSKCIQFCKLKT